MPADDCGQKLPKILRPIDMQVFRAPERMPTPQLPSSGDRASIDRVEAREELNALSCLDGAPPIKRFRRKLERAAVTLSEFTGDGQAVASSGSRRFASL